MKTIKGLNEHLVPIHEDLEDKKLMPSFRFMLKAALGKASAESHEEAIDAYAVGMKLRKEGDIVELEDSEFKLLQEACKKMVKMWQAHFYAQVLLKLEDK